MGQGFCQMVPVVSDDADQAAAAAIGRVADGLRAEGHSLLYAATARDGAAQVRRTPPSDACSWTGISGAPTART
jgi:hypothetical protein